MHARVTRFDGDPSKFDQAVAFAKDQALPTAQKQSGFKKYYALGDRSTGKGLVITIWDSEAAMKASEATASQTRSSAGQQVGVKVTGVEHYEVTVEA